MTASTIALVHWLAWSCLGAATLLRARRRRRAVEAEAAAHRAWFAGVRRLDLSKYSPAPRGGV